MTPNFLIRCPLYMPNRSVEKVAFSPDLSRMVSISRDGTAFLWHFDEIKAGNISQETAPEPNVDYSEPTKSEFRRPFKLTHEGPVLAAAFNRVGDRVVTAAEDGAAILWDADTADRVAVLRGHKNAVTSVVFNSDGNLLLTASDDRSVRLWGIFTDTETLEAHARELLGERELSDSERRRIYSY